MKLGKSVILALSSSLILGLIYGCGGGSSSDIAIDTSADGDSGGYITVIEELNGTISENSETGVTIYETEETEIKPGLLFKRSTVLTPMDPYNDQLGYSAMSILKFTNTTDSEETTKFIENIPKSFATHVDQLEYKVLINQSPNLTIDDLLNDSSSFVSIDDFVNNGYAEVLEEDPVLSYLGALAGAVSAYVVYYYPHKFGITSISNADDVNAKDDVKRKEWVDNALLTKYCSAIRQSAETNNIPAKLLANIVLNEMADYGWSDLLQEIQYTGEDKSHGWPQLQPNRITEHGLIDIGAVDQVRDPTVDIVESDLTAYEGVDESGFPVLVKTPVNEKVWERLVTPEPSIELAAREIVWLLDMLKEGSTYLNYPWAKALLIEPEKGIDRDKIYENLKVLPGTSTDPDELQIAKDRTLALLIAAGYNGSGNMFTRKEEKDVFTPIELAYITESGYDGLRENNSPWVMPSDLSNINQSTGTYLYSFAQPRIHGINAGDIFPKVLHESDCLEIEVVEEPVPTVTVSKPSEEACLAGGGDTDGILDSECYATWEEAMNICTIPSNDMWTAVEDYDNLYVGSNYWSSTVDGYDEEQAWSVILYSDETGTGFVFFPADKSKDKYVMCID